MVGLPFACLKMKIEMIFFNFEIYVVVVVAMAD